jgi:rubrerythrin
MAKEKRLIDANALRERFEKIAYKCEYIEDMVFHLDEIADEIEDVPTVDAVEVVHGRWINDAVEGFSPFTDSPIWIDVMQCSVCKEYIDGSHPKNYCPHCGAKMEGWNEDVLL